MALLTLTFGAALPAAAGLFAAGHATSRGAHKDCPFEGYLHARVGPPGSPRVGASRSVHAALPRVQP